MNISGFDSLSPALNDFNKNSKLSVNEPNTLSPITLSSLSCLVISSKADLSSACRHPLKIDLSRLFVKYS